MRAGSSRLTHGARSSVTATRNGSAPPKPGLVVSGAQRSDDLGQRARVDRRGERRLFGDRKGRDRPGERGHLRHRERRGLHDLGGRAFRRRRSRSREAGQRRRRPHEEGRDGQYGRAHTDPRATRRTGVAGGGFGGSGLEHVGHCALPTGSRTTRDPISSRLF
ncbi:MAG: hypothetical protein ABS61_12905 [Microbacterium sp. SCN 70-18]|nr:MAG: hypothetical protein ABS61_12905 [Microbacterium sp. SCN 70-18]